MNRKHWKQLQTKTITPLMGCPDSLGPFIELEDKHYQLSQAKGLEIAYNKSEQGC